MEVFKCIGDGGHVLEVGSVKSSYIAQNDHRIWVSSGGNDVYVQNEGPASHQVVLDGAAQMDQPEEEM